jgi:hypothetical protein
LGIGSLVKFQMASLTESVTAYLTLKVVCLGVDV